MGCGFNSLHLLLESLGLLLKFCLQEADVWEFSCDDSESLIWWHVTKFKCTLEHPATLHVTVLWRLVRRGWPWNVAEALINKAIDLLLALSTEMPIQSRNVWSSPSS